MWDSEKLCSLCSSNGIHTDIMSNRPSHFLEDVNKNTDRENNKDGRRFGIRIRIRIREGVRGDDGRGPRRAGEFFCGTINATGFSVVPGQQEDLIRTQIRYKFLLLEISLSSEL